MTASPMPTTEAQLVDRLAGMPRDRRTLVGIVGAPGSGKSTAADTILAALEARTPGRAAVLPMDGFHYDDGLLTARGLLARKGAPETFDVGGFYHVLRRLRAQDEDEVIVPVFDRGIEVARAGARAIPASADLILAEGNYLLLDRDPWTRLAGVFDLTVFIDVAEDELRRRLEARWTGHGLAPEAIRAKLEQNDLPNGRLVRTSSRAADYVMTPRSPG
ncbi:nucleoside/nucleotide kinase family protein [Roseivivax isoporae]|uniref:Phosphoribulokinase/uridine kinase domain-containing protein n=1 Tax=Roseivivax isoporae LMG 25204 TaxID=1449351 RepID=X7F800_9RHOB|nr:nucleoside/nucleotide kinase family protein [Roseivivax isoporae]ETX28863.1 hypothetical protein RISW2_03910 [Roseivivax isoporae LMG 25204]